MQRFYLLFLSLALSLFCTPPAWASGKVANTSNNIAPITGASGSRPVYQDYASTEPNYLDRRHALVGHNCMVNRLNTTVSVASGAAHLENLVDKDLTNSAKFINGVDARLISGLTGATGYVPAFTIRDVKNVYKAGTTAGFVVNMDNSVLKATAINAPMKIYFYKDGEYKGEASCDQKSGSLLNLQVATISNNTLEFTAIAPCDFDEVGLGSASLLDANVVGVMTMKYAFVGKNGKYYIDNETTNGINDFKTTVKKEYPQTEFLNDQLVLGRCFIHDYTYNEDPDDWIIDNRSSDDRQGSTIPITVSAYGGNDNKNMPFKAGMTIGFEVGEGNLLSIAHYLSVKPFILTKNDKGKRTWAEQEADGGEFTLLGLNIGAGHRDVVATLKSDCNAAELSFGGVNIGLTVAYRMFVVLPPSIDEDPNLTVTADRSLCDEKQTVTLHSDEAVTWECSKTPEGATQPTLTNADDGLSCTVSGFVNEGHYEFTAKTKDGRKATTTVTYGVRPIINTAIRPWVNNFTERDVNYSADIKSYNDKYQILNASLIPEIRTGSDNLVTPSLDDYASAGGVSLLNHQMLFGVVRSSKATYKEKVTVGFVARTKWTALNLNLLNGLKVKVYDAGKEATTVSSENTHFKVLSAGLIDGQNYVTTQYSVEIDANTPFDAITLWNNGLLSADLSEMDVYYAFVEPSTLAQKYNDDVAKSWQPITHSATGASIDASKLSTFGVAKVADAVDNLTNIIDDDNTNYATLAGLATVGAGHSVAVKLGRKFEGGHQVKFIVSNEDWLNVELGKFINLKAYLNGNEVATKTSWDVLNLNVIGGENKEAEILWTPTDDDKKPVDFDEISISFNGVANVADVAWIYGIQVANDADGDGIIDANDDESCDNPYLIDENESKLDKAHDYVHGKLNLRRYMKPDLVTFSKGQWFSICLPVDLTFNQFVKTFGNNAVLAKPMNFIDGHAGTLVFNIDAVYGNNVLLHKDTPYIIKLADPQNFQKVDNSLKTELDNNNDNVTAATSKVDSVYIIQGVDYSMTENSKLKTETILCVHSTSNTGYPSVVWQGTYVAPTVLDKGYYTLNNGYITHYTQRGNSHFRGLRCWMYEVNGSSEAKPFDVNIFGNTEDLTTAIRDIEATTAVVNGNIYSIDGQLVRANATSTANLPMGIYIWNHKKIVIK